METVAKEAAHGSSVRPNVIFLKFFDKLNLFIVKQIKRRGVQALRPGPQIFFGRLPEVVVISVCYSKKYAYI